MRRVILGLCAVLMFWLGAALFIGLMILMWQIPSPVFIGALALALSVGIYFNAIKDLE